MEVQDLNNRGEDDNIVINWKDDPGEKAHRIFEWWKLRVHDTKCFSYYKTVLRSVVLTQPSSAFIERVFSQWQRIIDNCGVQQKKEMVECCIFSRCNE